jgi:hypothetical protein
LLTPANWGSGTAPAASRAHNSAVECVLHTDEVAGSIPAAPTEIIQDFSADPGGAVESSRAATIPVASGPSEVASRAFVGPSPRALGKRGRAASGMVRIPLVRITYRLCVFASECDASAIAHCTLTSGSASAVVKARRNEWKSTGSVAAVSKYSGSFGLGPACVPKAHLPRSVRMPALVAPSEAPPMPCDRGRRLDDRETLRSPRSHTGDHDPKRAVEELRDEESQAASGAPGSPQRGSHKAAAADNRLQDDEHRGEVRAGRGPGHPRLRGLECITPKHAAVWIDHNGAGDS